jgi:RNA polymerase sigma factor (sigma-70 family)
VSFPRLPEEIRASEALFEPLFSKIRSSLLRRIASDLRDPVVAEDILQQTAARVLRAVRRGKMGIINEPALFAYCATTAYRLSLTYLAHTNQLAASNEALGDDELDKLQHPRQAHPDTVILLREVYGDLSEEERTIFMMMFQGYSAEDVGERLGKTANNIAQIRYRATLRIGRKYRAVTSKSSKERVQ